MEKVTDKLENLIGKKIKLNSISGKIRKTTLDNLQYSFISDGQQEESIDEVLLDLTKIKFINKDFIEYEKDFFIYSHHKCLVGSIVPSNYYELKKFLDI